MPLPQLKCLKSCPYDSFNCNFKRDLKSIPSVEFLPSIRRSRNLIIHAATESEAEIFFDIPDPEHIILSNSFPATAVALREHFDDRFADPLKATWKTP